MAKKDKFGDNRPIRPTNGGAFSQARVTKVRGRRKSARVMARVLVYGGVVVVAFSLIMISFGAYQSWKLNKQLNYQLSETYNPSFKTKHEELGSLIVQNWFAGKQAPIRYSSDINWASSQPETPSVEDFQPAAAETIPNVRDIAYIGGYQNSIDLGNAANDFPEFRDDALIEVLNYYLVYNNIPYTTSISLIVSKSDDSVLPVLATSPTLEPADRTGSVNLNGDPKGQGLESVKLPNAAVDAIGNWAEAWASNNSVTLKQITKDSSENVYRGLGGWSVEGVPTVNWSYNKLIGSKTYVVTQVRFNIVQNVELPADRDNPNSEPRIQKFVISQTQDILLTDVKSGLPSIIAWGPAGSWNALEPLMNALPPGTEVGEKADGIGDNSLSTDESANEEELTNE